MIQLISKPVTDEILVSKELLGKAKERYQGKQVIITIEEFSPKKLSQKRRQYFAGIVMPFVQKTGYDRNKMHDELKYICNPREQHDVLTGEIRIVGGSTKDFTTAEEWEEYKHKCRELGKKLGVSLMTEEEYYNSLAPNEPTQPLGEQP